MRRYTWTMILVLCCGLDAARADDWHHPLYLGNGGCWRQRVRLEVSNDRGRDATGEPVVVAIGRGEGEAALAGARAEAVRVCDSSGTEMLFGIYGPSGGERIARGVVPGGSRLVFPVECPSRGKATYYVYFDNPDAWAVPDFLRLERTTPSKLDVRAARVERLRLREIGDADPDVEAAGDALRGYTVPVKVLNLSAAGLEGLVCADLSAAVARSRHRLPISGFRISGGPAPIRCFRLEDAILFESRVPARTLMTYRVLTVPGGPQPAPLDYAALLESRWNLAGNASFEDGDPLPSRWSATAAPRPPEGIEMGLDGSGRFGSRCARTRVSRDSSDSWTGWRQRVRVEPNRTYLYAGWVKCEDLRGTVQLHAHYRDESGELCRTKKFAAAGRPISGTTDWTLMSGLFEMPGDASYFDLHLTMRAAGTAWHDGVVLAPATPGAPGRPSSLEKEAAALRIWPVNAIVKVFPDDKPPREKPPARIAAARNEAEPLQLAVRSPSALDGVRVVVTPPKNDQGAKLSDLAVAVVGYVPIDHKTSYYQSDSPAWHRRHPTAPGRCDGWPGLWPDPLLPRDTFDLEARKTRPVWITLNVPKGAASGVYRGDVRLVRRGATLADIPFEVRVWDFALPDASHLRAVYDLRLGPRWLPRGKDRDEVRRRFWRFMAERRVCPDRIRPDPVLRYRDGEVVADFAAFDRAAELYLEELGLPHTYTPGYFYLFGWGNPPAAKFGERPYEGEYPYDGADRAALRPQFKRAYQACLAAYWEHVKEKGWADRCLLYISDEPYYHLEPIRRQMKALCDMIHEVDPEIPIFSSTWHHRPEWDGYIDVWGIGHYGSVSPAAMERLLSAGDRLWFTTDGQMCTDTPYCAVERLLPHYCFQYRVEAYEFWGVSWLTYDPYEFGWHSYIHQSGEPGKSTWVRYPNGDGFLAYPGEPAGHDGPVSSVRLEQAREGVEDYEYLYLLRSLIREREAAGKRADRARRALRLARALVAIPNAGGRYSTKILPDPDRVFEAREEVAAAIEELGREERAGDSR